MVSAARATRDDLWLDRAIDRYHELCADPSLAGPQVVRDFAQAQVSAGLTFGGAVQCRSLRPAFVTHERLAALRRAVRDFRACIGIIERRALSDASLAARLGLNAAERALIEIDPGYEGATVVSRLDTFFDAAPRVIEYNADSPAGMSYQAGQAELMRALPVFARYALEYDCEELRADVALRETLVSVWREFCTRKQLPARLPSVAILDLAGAATSTEFALVSHDLEAHGMSSCIATPDDLRYEGGSLYAFGRQIDLVYKRLLVADFIERYDLTHPLVRAYADGAACVVSSFRCTIGHKKRVLAELCYPGNAAWFTEAQRTAIAQLVAPTWAARDVDEERLIAEREELVLKPNDAHGGENVLLGWECDEQTWCEAVTHTRTADYVAQRRVRPPLGTYPVFDATAPERGAKPTPLIEDRNAYVFRDELGGILTRLSSTGIINVSRGGQAIPTFVLRPRE
ncbi:MAG TPA: hypothetical protein VEJ41_06715 [Candidatus Acidoferrales bacterium]|nr:hypothetical protein [Candidatus Acidoferrales bacterium]